MDKMKEISRCERAIIDMQNQQSILSKQQHSAAKASKQYGIISGVFAGLTVVTAVLSYTTLPLLAILSAVFGVSTIGAMNNMMKNKDEEKTIEMKIGHIGDDIERTKEYANKLYKEKYKPEIVQKNKFENDKIIYKDVNVEHENQ